MDIESIAEGSNSAEFRKKVERTGSATSDRSQPWGLANKFYIVKVWEMMLITKVIAALIGYVGRWWRQGKPWCYYLNLRSTCIRSSRNILGCRISWSPLLLSVQVICWRLGNSLGWVFNNWSVLLDLALLPSQIWFLASAVLLCIWGCTVSVPGLQLVNISLDLSAAYHMICLAKHCWFSRLFFLSEHTCIKVKDTVHGSVQIQIRSGRI